MAVDAFTIDWSKIYFYAFPPFSLLLKVLNKIKRDKATGVVVFPLWETQPWYPLLKQLMVSEPLIFSPNKTLLLSPFREPYPMWRSLTLAAAILSGKHTATEGYLKQPSMS